MSELFASGRIIDAILALIAVEAVAIVAYRRRTGQGPDIPVFLANLVSGACLMVALRGALVGGWWGWIGAWLAAAGIAHLAALRLGWR